MVISQVGPIGGVGVLNHLGSHSRYNYPSALPFVFVFVCVFFFK